MPIHIVAQGEHIVRIAEDHGFSDIRTIWDHPDNAELKNLRKNPNVLLPGDELFIPDLQSRNETGATEKRHRFRFLGQSLQLRLRLLDYGNQPLADAACELRVEGQVHVLTTDSDGRIEQEIPKTAETAQLVFKDPRAPFENLLRIEIGQLDPITEVSGQQARLINLGYFSPREDARDAERFNHAVQEFQCDHDLKVTGDVGPETQAKLEEIHGC